MEARDRIRASYSAEVTEQEKEHRAIARRIAAEGIVLLENDGALPLENGGRIALYGSGARHTVYGGSGSGEVNTREKISIEQGLIRQGAVIATQPWLDRYDRVWREKKAAYIARMRKKLKKFDSRTLAELIASDYLYPDADEITEEDLRESKTDRCIYVVSRQSGEGRDRERSKGDYELTDVEEKNIRNCARFYQTCIVVINTGSSMDLRALDGIEGINAVVYMALLGMESGGALADILYGAVCPSGRLAATWAQSYEDWPGASEFGQWAADPKRIRYEEGLLTGYRYFDRQTIRPRYTFGYGLSYTAFSEDVTECRLHDGRLTVRVAVENTGRTAGKHTVGIYAGSADFKEGSGEPKKILIGFGKTELLQPKEKTEMTLVIPLQRLRVYDERKKRMVIAAGNYLLYLGADAGQARAAGNFEITQTKDAYDPIGEREEPPETEKRLRAEDFSEREWIELCVGNGLFSDGKGYQVPGAVGCTTTCFLERGVRNILMCDGPAGIRLQNRSTVGSNGKIKPVDFPLSFYEVLPEFLVKRLLGNPEKETVLYQFVTGFPTATAAAQTWNKELCYEMGRAVGKEMETYGIALWLAPAINLIRNPLCGRNYEYYSEDPVLTGELAVCLIKGVQQTPGRGVTVKHFACNNQETDRYYMSSELSERTLREHYLKAFEIVVREGGPKALMTAYNKINGVYASEHAHLLQDVLRNEWGYRGLVMTDWLAVGEDRADEAASIRAGVDLIMPGNRRNKKELRRALRAGRLDREDLLRAASHVLHVIEEEG